MMKRNLAAILCVLPLFVLECDRDHDRRLTKRVHPSEVNREGVTTPRDSAFYHLLFDTIRALEDSVAEHPADTLLASRLHQAALDTSAGSFFVVGKGAVNPKHPKAAQAAGRQTAARYSGERWALYLKAWHLGNLIPFGAFLEGNVMYAKNVWTIEKQDTLYALIQIPIGSVVVHSTRNK